jgi:hypothetical protein
MNKLDRLGFHEPEGTISEMVHLFMEDGMHYERMHDDIGLIVAADHEDVGLVTYYRCTPEQWNELVDGSEGDLVEGVGTFRGLYVTEED